MTSGASLVSPKRCGDSGMYHELGGVSLSSWLSLFSAAFVTFVAVRGLVVRLREMPHRKQVIRMKVGERIVDYDPDDLKRSQAMLSEALNESAADGTPSR